jgi:hypothetical protein
MAAAACSRRRCPGPRLPSGWKNSSGLAPRHAPCRCHRNFLVDDPERPRRSAIGTSKRVVTTVTAPEASETIRRGVRVVDGPDWTSPAGAPVRTRPAALRRGGSPGSQPDPVRENRGCGSESTVGSPWRSPRIPSPRSFRGAWRLPGPTSSRAPPPGCPDGRREASLVPGAGVLNACAGGSVRTGPGPALAQPVSQHVTGVGLGIAHGHQGCGNFSLGEDHPIEKITRYRGGVMPL